jgi:hypothetical protein
MKTANKRLHADPKSGGIIGVTIQGYQAAFWSGEPKR